MPTDTIYGLVGSALDSEAVEQIYKLKGRQPGKPMVILIHHIAEIKRFDIELDGPTTHTLDQYWPGPTSIVLPCNSDEFMYLHRDSQTLAFRLPDKPDLRETLAKTGPLVAPSVNPEGQPFATTIEEAQRYFGDQVDFYVDGGELDNEPSALLKLESDGSLTKLR